MQRVGFPLESETVAVIDMDKTTVGARGRNDKVIDQARVQAVHETVADILGDRFDADAFAKAYDTLNQPAYHPFTGDNQDVLAYLCLMIGGGVIGVDELADNIRTGRVGSFDVFIRWMDERPAELAAAGLTPIHRDVFSAWAAGDPTPFKPFRYNEYRATIERMGHLDDGASVAELLEKEIVITQEVREMALKWRAQGALLFGLSDKPDEASIPPDDLAAQGYRAIHRVETHAVGE